MTYTLGAYLNAFLYFFISNVGSIGAAALGRCVYVLRKDGKGNRVLEYDVTESEKKFGKGK